MWIGIASTAIIGVLLAGLPAAVEPAQTPPTVSLTYDLPRVVTLGEPVLMDLVVHNGSDAPAFFDLRHPTSFTFTMTRPDGTTVTASIRERRAQALDGTADLEPGYHQEHQVVLNGFLDFFDTGTYHLLVRFGGRVEPRSPRARLVVPPATREYVLEVRPRDEARLREICEQALPDLRTISLEMYRAAKRLSWVQDPVAVPYLVRAVEIMPGYLEFWEAFIRIGSEDARRALNAMIEGDNRELASRARSTLARFGGGRG